MPDLNQAAYDSERAAIYARYPLLAGMVGPEPSAGPDVAEQWEKRRAELCALDERYRAASVRDRQEVAS
jgi:hypothetical protein